MSLIIATEDPSGPDVRRLLEAHLGFARRVTPPEDVHALDIEGLVDPRITFFGCRSRGELVGVGALLRLDALHGEFKSMHTDAAARGQGVGRALVNHLLTVASARGFRRVSLETGTMAAFAPARSLYASIGFEACEPFAGYRVREASICMTIDVARWRARDDDSGGHS